MDFLTYRETNHTTSSQKVHRLGPVCQCYHSIGRNDRHHSVKVTLVWIKQDIARPCQTPSFHHLLKHFCSTDLSLSGIPPKMSFQLHDLWNSSIPRHVSTPPSFWRSDLTEGLWMTLKPLIPFQHLDHLAEMQTRTQTTHPTTHKGVHGGLPQILLLQDTRPGLDTSKLL